MDINYNGIIRDMKNISFNTPLYECISNSIEAGATNILIKINLRNNIQSNTIEEHILIVPIISSSSLKQQFFITYPINHINKGPIIIDNFNIPL